MSAAIGRGDEGFQALLALTAGKDRAAVLRAQQDSYIYGNGYLKREADGSLSRIDPTTVHVSEPDRPPVRSPGHDGPHGDEECICGHPQQAHQDDAGFCWDCDACAADPACREYVKNVLEDGPNYDHEVVPVQPHWKASYE
jgi:hypothetical protein